MKRTLKTKLKKDQKLQTTAKQSAINAKLDPLDQFEFV